jgi:hypothetical protein
MLVLLVVISGNVNGYFNLTVGDPRASWWTYPGTIEQAEVHVKPKGIYMDFDLYLTFSASGSYFSSTDTLEVVLNFDLPQGAIVHDSWLWYGEDTLRARLLDKWTATSIYEGVVNRRRDPSILQKIYQNQYELRVFPMAGNETRKVKISFMLPTKWTNDKVSAEVVTNILQTSSIAVEKLTVITFTDNTWKNPVLTGTSSVTFTKQNSGLLGQHYKAEVPNADFTNNIGISFNSPAIDGVYVSKFENEGEGLFQMALIPSAFYSPSDGQKVAFLFDYDISKTNLTIDQVLMQTRDFIISNLSPTDSFNLLFSNISTKRASNKWLPADSLTIANTFNNLVDPLSSYSNLPSLISSGIDFVNTNGNNADMVLISNSVQYGETEVANKLLNDIMDLMDTVHPFYIADFADNYYEYQYINGRSYYNNEYLFSNLSKFTKGSYDRIIDGKSFNVVVENSMKYMGGFIKSFDLYTKLTNGLCYGRYNIGSTSDLLYLKNSILQVGKYSGDFPFEISLSGEFESEIVSNDIVIDEPDILISDSLVEEMWSAAHIEQLEKQTQSNDVIAEIIRNSINERVLSLYTAFLCIEESLIPCDECNNENGNAIPEIMSPKKDFLKVYPNPFTSAVTITVDMGDNIAEKILKVGIYNITGQLVYSPEITELESQQQFELYWDGMDKEGNILPAGVYIFTLQTNQGIYQVKITKQ